MKKSALFTARITLWILGVLIMAGSGVAHTLFTAPLGAQRSYRITTSSVSWRGPAHSGLPDFTLEQLIARKSKLLEQQTSVCTVLERVVGVREDGAREVDYSYSCWDSDSPDPGGSRTSFGPMRFVYLPDGRIQRQPIQSQDPAPSRGFLGATFSSARMLERTPWGDFPRFYGPDLPAHSGFSEDLGSALGSGQFPVLSTVSRRSSVSGKLTLVRVAFGVPQGAVGPSSAEVYFERPFEYLYKLALDPDGRVQRGSFRLSLAVREGNVRYLGRALGEIVALE